MARKGIAFGGAGLSITGRYCGATQPHVHSRSPPHPLSS